MLIGRAPLRISFSGGGTDLEEYHSKFTGYAISSTINKFTFVMAKLRFDDKLQGFSPDFASYLPPTKISKTNNLQGHEIVTSSLKKLGFKKGIDVYLSTEVPPNSGLGASSSLTTNIVKVITSLQGKKISPNKIGTIAYEIGHDVLEWGVGKQDEFASSYGGLNLYKFTKSKVTVSKINLNKSTKKELQNNSLLVYLGKRKHSVGILKKQINAIQSSKIKTIDALHKSKELTLEMKDALKANDLEKFSSILKRGWEVKKKFSDGISNKRIDKIVLLAEKNGAKAVKVTGAGGGGHMYIYAQKSKHNAIINSLKRLGVSKVDFAYHDFGAKVFDVNSL